MLVDGIDGLKDDKCTGQRTSNSTPTTNRISRYLSISRVAIYAGSGKREQLWSLWVADCPPQRMLNETILGAGACSSG